MTRQEMLDYITQSIQTDATLIKLLRLIVTNNIQNVSDDQLQIIVTYLQGGN